MSVQCHGTTSQGRCRRQAEEGSITCHLHEHHDVRGAYELKTNTEIRRPGEVAIGVFGGKPDGFAWVSADKAREFAMELLRAARDADDYAQGLP